MIIMQKKTFFRFRIQNSIHKENLRHDKVVFYSIVNILCIEMEIQGKQYISPDMTIQGKQVKSE
jgi:hypothetical protein